MSLPVAISYSGGASSQWLIDAIAEGVIPRPEHVAVFFADTFAEHSWTYTAVERTQEKCKRLGIPFFTCAHPLEGLTDHLLAIESEGRTRADHPPFWIAKGHGRGKASHRCTFAFKVAPMRRAQAAWLEELGLPKRLVKWIGFAADEGHRAQKTLGKQDVQWEQLDFPLIRLGKGRAEQRADVATWTGNVPRFSMCTFCPFKSPQRWFQTPESERKQAYEVDEAIRDLDTIGLTDGPAYLTDRLIPVQELFERGDPQPNLPGLESYCDGGACFL